MLIVFSVEKIPGNGLKAVARDFLIPANSTVFYDGANLTLTSNDGKNLIDLVMEAGHEKAAVLLG